MVTVHPEGVRAVVTGHPASYSENASSPGADGVGLEQALANFAGWFHNEYVWNCKSSPLSFFKDIGRMVPDTASPSSLQQSVWGLRRLLGH